VNFSKFARQHLTTGVVSVARDRALADELRRQISPIGNNINQIARKANVDDSASMVMIADTFRLLTDVYTLVGQLGEQYGVREDHADQDDAESSS